jgi:hypothetical protein
MPNEEKSENNYSYFKEREWNKDKGIYFAFISVLTLTVIICVFLSCAIAHENILE